MIPKSKQGDKLRSLAAVQLLLSAAALAQSSGDIADAKPFAEYDLSPTNDRAQFHTDLTYAHQSIIATREVSTGFWIKLVTPGPNSTTSECFEPFSPEVIHDTKRLSYKTVLLETRPIGKQLERKLVLLNVKNCNYVPVYDGPLPLDYKIFPSSNASNESFALLMHGKKYCRGLNWCRLLFNPFYSGFEPLNFDFTSSGFYNVEPVASFDGNLFVVDLLDDATQNTYIKRLYNVSDISTSRNYKELLHLANYVSFRGRWSQMELISSSLSHCWRTNRDTDEDKVVHCAAFREDGTAVINQTIVYADVVKFYKVQSIPNGLILIGKRNCADRAQCSDVQSTVITNESCADSGRASAPRPSESITVVRNVHYHFQCRPLFVSRMYFRVKVSDGSVDVDHMCIYEKRADYQNTHSYISRG